MISCKHASDEEMWEKYKQTWNHSKTSKPDTSHKANATKDKPDDQTSQKPNHNPSTANNDKAKTTKLMQ